MDRSDHMLVCFKHRSNPLDTKSFSDVVAIVIYLYECDNLPARKWAITIEHDNGSISIVFVPACYLIEKVDMDTRR